MLTKINEDFYIDFNAIEQLCIFSECINIYYKSGKFFVYDNEEMMESIKKELANYTRMTQMPPAKPITTSADIGGIF